MTFTVWKFITDFIVLPIMWLWFFNKVLEPRYKGKWVILLQIVYLLLFSVIFILLIKISFLRLSISIVADIIILHFLFKDSIGRKIFIEIIYKLCIVGAEIITYIWIPLILDVSFVKIISSGKMDFQIYFVFNFLVILFLTVFATIIKRTTYGFKWTDFIQFSIFPISQIILLVLLSYIAITFEQNNISLFNYVFLIAGLICIVADVFLVRFMKAISEKSKLETENIYLQQLQELQYEHYHSLKKQQDYIRGLRHDIINHIETVNILLKKSKHEEAEKYNIDLKEQFYQTVTADYCENTIVDAILHNKIEYAHSLGIQTEVNMSVPKNINIDDIDLMRIFSNLLDNAIEGCLSDNINVNRFIIANSRIKANYLIIKVENSKSKEQKGTQTTKKDRLNHGHGLNIVTEITKKYDGIIQIDDKGDTFIVLVSLQCDNNKELSLK